jgi:HD-like signal output (HDOD) protein
MSDAEKLRLLVSQIADLQKTAAWDTQVALAKAAEVLVREAGRLESGAGCVVVERVRGVK